jgi:hypothetical protein
VSNPKTSNSDAQAQQLEAQRARADITINRQKATGELQRQEALRAHWADVNQGFQA